MAVVPLVYARAKDAVNEEAANVTMRLGDVLSALGYQKMVNLAERAMKPARVDASLSLTEDGTPAGWGVSADAIVAALNSLPEASIPAGSTSFFASLGGTRWEVSINGLGDPVRITAPRADRLIDPTGGRCRA